VGPEIVVPVILMSAAGSLMGIVTGILPGIHVNTLASLMLVSYPSMAAGLSPLLPDGTVPAAVAACVVSAGIAHSFVDFVPSVFLGAPGPDEIVSMTPGHRLLHSGRGAAAVRASAAGSAVGAVSALVFAVPLQYVLMDGAGEYLDSLTLAVLIIVSCLIVLREDNVRGIVWSSACMALSGLLGVVCMWAGPTAVPLGDGNLLFPLLTGLFGVPMLLGSAAGGAVPPQTDTGICPVDAWPGIKGSITGCLVGWFPGITATTGAVLSGMAMPEERPERFISMVASIGTASAVFTLVTLSVSGSGRSGVMVVAGDIIGEGLGGFCSPTFLLLLLGVAVASVLGYAATLAFGRVFCDMANRADPRRTSLAVLIALLALTVLLTGQLGVAVLAASVTVGLVPSAAGTDRTCLTGCLIIPSLVSGMV